MELSKKHCNGNGCSVNPFRIVFSQEVQKEEEAQQEAPDSSQDDAEAKFLGRVLGDMAWK